MEKKAVAIDVNKTEWEERPQPSGKSYFRKMLVWDHEEGIRVNMAKYPAGYVTTWHTHPCAHGMLVMEGTLCTSDGNFGPGTFVWHPEGVLMEHGAPPDEDVTVLFITNKPFSIDFVDKEEK